MDSGGGNRLLGTTSTDSVGDYSITVCNLDPFDGPGIDPLLVVYSTDEERVDVKDNATIAGTTYSVALITDEDITGDTYEMNFILSDPLTIREAFFVFDLIANTAYDTLTNNSDWNNNEELTVAWPQGCLSNSSNGACYGFDVLDSDPYSVGTVYLPEQQGWDPDVILHEYSHFVLSRYYGNAPIALACANSQTGLNHSITDHSTKKCAWSEGWADFLQAAIQAHATTPPNYTNNTNYVDSAVDINGNFTFINIPIESAELFLNAIIGLPYDDTELAVAASLWDIFDDAAAMEPFDVVFNDFDGPSDNGIWTLATGLGSFPSPNVDNFWDAWDASSNGQECEIATILQHHTIPLGNIYTLKVQLQPSTVGSVTRNPLPCAGDSYDAGSTVDLSASPTGSYVFREWTGDETSTSNPLSLTVDADKTFQANFAPSAPANLTGSSTISGTTATVDLDWDVVSGTGITYSIYRSPTSPVAIISANRQASSISTNSYSYNTTATGTMYYAVTAVDQGSNESAASNEVSVAVVPALLAYTPAVSACDAQDALSNMNDGNTSTRLRCRGVYTTYTATLGGTYALDHLRFWHSNYDGDQLNPVSIQISVDGSYFVQVATVSNPSVGQWIDVNLAGHTANYVRVQGAYQWSAMNEFEVYGYAVTPPPALGIPYTPQTGNCSTSDSLARMHDGTALTRVACIGAPTSYTAALGGTYALDHLRFWHTNYSGDQLNPASVQLSVDGSYFVEVATVSNPPVGQWVTVDLTGYTANYVRVQGAYQWSAMNELEVYGVSTSPPSPAGVTYTAVSGCAGQDSVANIHDGTAFTRMRCQSAQGAYVQATLTQVISLGDIRFWHTNYSGDQLGSTLIQVSTNGTTYTTAVTLTNPAANTWVTVNLTGNSARYIRIVQNSNAWFAFNEFEIYEAPP